MKLSAILAPLIAAGVPGEVILATVKAFEDQQTDSTEKGKEKARARWRKWKDNQPTNVSKRLPTTANASNLLVRVEDSSSKKDISGKEESKNLSHEFETEFWPAYPRKVGKPAALKAYLAARKRSSFEAVMAGVRRYAQERAGEDAQFTKYPQGWLSGDHWNDEPTPRQAPRPHSTASPPPGKRMNAVEANLARRIRRNEPEGGRRDNGDAELLPPDRPGLPDFVRDAGKSLTWDG
jgi:hypothetical protein